MADKRLKSISFPGLLDRYTIPDVDNTLSLSGESADSKATGELTTLINGVNFLVDYDYHHPYKQVEKASSTAWKNMLSIDRTEAVITLGKTRDIDYNVMIKLSGTVELAASNPGVDEWITGITLKDGHDYQVLVKLISGESSYDTAEYDGTVPAASVYIAGTHNTITKNQRLEGLSISKFTAVGSNQYVIALYLHKNFWRFTDAKLLVTLEDLTDEVLYSGKQALFDSINVNKMLIDYYNQSINYGYDLVADLKIGDSSATSVGIKRNGNLIILNGTASSDVRIRLNGQVKRSSANATVDAWGEGISFTAGKEYILTLTQLSGTTTNVPGVSVYRGGEHSSVGQGTRNIVAGTFTRIFTAEEAITYNIALYVLNEMSLEDARYLLVMQEYHDESDEETGLPSYYTKTYINGIADKIIANQKKMGIRSKSFFFFSDPHFYKMDDGKIENGMNSVALIEKIGGLTNITDTICGGDLVNGSGITNANCIKYLSMAREYLSPIWNSLYFVIGNHEWNNPTNSSAAEYVAEEVSISQLYQLFLADKARLYGDVSDEWGCYWIDEGILKIRTFYLSCNKSANFRESEILWLAESLQNIPAGYAVLIISHIGIELDSEGNIGYTSQFAQVADMIDALKAKETYTYVRPSNPDWTRTFDYSNTNNIVIGVISGHTHVDLDRYTDGGIPIIGITCDRGPRSNSSVEFSTLRAYGTVNEQAIDAVQIDVTNRKIYTTRIGGTATKQSTESAYEALAIPDREYSF